jgi:formylglycine-generating enzyme required for sulfatase activity
VVGVTWFEARAYARWLNEQMKEDIKSLMQTQDLQAGYAIHLPTELQWERAARASSLSSSHTDPWPWGTQEDVAQRANISESGIEHVSSVGSFAPNPIGLCDMAGNAWQWMDNGYESEDRSMNTRINADEELPHHPALRGASWPSSPHRARCSSRDGYRPGGWNDLLGFRVVLSLA